MTRAGLKLEYSPRELGELLGVSRGTILRMISAGEVRARKRGNRWRIPLSFLQENVDRWESLLLRKRLIAMQSQEDESAS